MRTILLSLLAVLACWASAQQAPAKVTNIFTDADIRTVLSEVGTAAKATIIPDASVKDLTVSIELREDTVESALEKLAQFGNLVWKKKGEIYLVSTGLPDAPMFLEFAITKAYSPRTQAAESLFSLLAPSLQVFARVDKSANLLSVTGPETRVAKVIEALERVDAPQEQFIVEAMVTEIKQEKGKEFSFSWSWKNFAADALGGLGYAKASSADVAQVKSLISNGNAEMRANPRVVATQGKEAMITVGSETYFPINSGNAQYPTLTLQRISTGITLKFIGYIEPDGTMNLHLMPEVSDAVAAVNGAPTTTVRRADTNIRVKEGETFVLGGLILDTKKKNTSKVPVLGDLPLIGKLFGSESSYECRKEVVILITARRVNR